MPVKSKLPKLCVTEAFEHSTGRRTSGIYEWKGPNWHMAQMTNCIKEFPANFPRAKHCAAYRVAKKAQKEGRDIALALDEFIASVMVDL